MRRSRSRRQHTDAVQTRAEWSATHVVEVPNDAVLLTARVESVAWSTCKMTRSTHSCMSDQLANSLSNKTEAGLKALVWRADPVGTYDGISLSRLALRRGSELH